MTKEAAQPDPEPTRRMPGRIAYVLQVARTLLDYARHFTATAAERVAAPEFASAAVFFGTYDLPVILLRMRRAMVRALALERYLIKRAARGSNLRFRWPPRVELLPHHRPPVKPRAPRAPLTRPRWKDPALLGPDDPASWHVPTDAEADAWVRRQPVGRTIMSICVDIGLAPSLCDGDFWSMIDKVRSRFGGSIHPLYDMRAIREKSFERERDRRPETWHIDWRDTRPETVRKALGCRIGETPPDHGLPVIVPS